MTFPPNYHDPFAAGIPPDVVAAIEEQCGLPFLEAVEKYGGQPILCDDGHYVAIADPPGCGPEHFAAKAEAYRLLFDRQERAREVAEASAVPRLDATPAKPRRQRTPRRPTLASVSKQANKAGIEVARYEIKPDGTVVIVTGQPESTSPENPWLADLRKVTKQ